MLFMIFENFSRYQHTRYRLRHKSLHKITRSLFVMHTSDKNQLFVYTKLNRSVCWNVWLNAEKERNWIVYFKLCKGKQGTKNDKILVGWLYCLKIVWNQTKRDIVLIWSWCCSLNFRKWKPIYAQFEFQIHQEKIWAKYVKCHWLPKIYIHKQRAYLIDLWGHYSVAQKRKWIK